MNKDDIDFQTFVTTISPNREMNFLKAQHLHKEYDCLKIASYIFNIEMAIKLDYKFDHVELPISKDTLTSIKIEHLEKELTDMIRYTLYQDINIKFIADKARKQSRHYEIPTGKTDYVCLFSGGLDSLCGYIFTKKIHSVVPVSIIHSDQGRLTPIVKKLIQGLSEEYNEILDHHFLYAPRMHSKGYSQLRGFLYSLFGVIFCNLYNTNKLLIPEVGPTMYQPKFSPYDTVTMTTHPYVLEKTKKVASILFDKQYQYILPFENNTKAEIISLTPYDDLIKQSHSCVTVRWGDHDGLCYGCTIRRLAFIAAGVKDTEYKNDVLLDINNDHQDMILTLLRFCSDFLVDYDHLLYESKELIEEYNKHDLFHRFSLDNYAALYVLKKKEKTNKSKHKAII